MPRPREVAHISWLLVVWLAGCGGGPPEVERADLSSGALRGTIEKIPEVGAAFRLLSHADFPDRSLYHPRWGGLNFEHVLNGSEPDSALNWFTPRSDPHRLLLVSDQVAIVDHAAGDSSWGIESRMTYSFHGESAIDMDFRVTPGEDRFPNGFVAFMWASYVQGAADPRIHFFGRRGDVSGWQTLGGDEPGGTVAAVGAEALDADPTRVALNISVHPVLNFELPFYYGLLDGDGDRATPDDRMAYLMMFDQSIPIRLCMWNCFTHPGGPIDPDCPAWDWQYVIRDPQRGREYGYRARLEYFPFTDREDVLRRYHAWRATLPGEAPDVDR